MKKSNYYLIVMVSVMGLLTMGSCSLFEQDPCAAITCENGGSCDEGICDCPDGFSGTNCEIEDLCFNVTCENGGTCLDGSCDCPFGFFGDNCEVIDTIQIQALLDSGTTPKTLLDGGVSLEQLYGKTYEDGFIFYLNTDDGTGMVAAAVDQSTEAIWGCFEDDITGLNNIDDFPDGPETEEGARIGDGAANTTAILAQCMTGDIAAKLCKDLGEDWFLPSRGELNLMYTNLHAKGTGGFAAAWYWSSTEIGFNDAWIQLFNDGDLNFVGKNDYFQVRAARAF